MAQAVEGIGSNRMGAGNSGGSTMSNARDCAIKCGQPLFRAFMREELQDVEHVDHIPEGATWTQIRDAEEAARAVRFLLMIDSRRELKDGPAAQRWDRLAGKFEMWKRE